MHSDASLSPGHHFCRQTNLQPHALLGKGRLKAGSSCTCRLKTLHGQYKHKKTVRCKSLRRHLSDYTLLFFLHSAGLVQGKGDHAVLARLCRGFNDDCGRTIAIGAEATAI